MAIQWGAWRDSGGNGIRVGVDVSVPGVAHGTGAITVTYAIYTQNRYSFSDDQTLNFSGSYDGGGSASFRNSSGGGQVRRATRTFRYTYGANSYGSSPGTRSFTARLSGVFSGITPAVTVTWRIPARPIAAPNPPASVQVARVSDSALRVTWTNKATSGRPYGSLSIQRWAYGGNWVAISNPGGGSTSFTNSGNFGNQRFAYRVRANNGAGSSGWVQSARFAWGTPAAPTGVTRTTVSGRQRITWRNNVGYPEYQTLIYRATNGNWGSQSPVARLAAEATAWTDPTALSNQNAYTYRARTVTTGSGAGTRYSAYSGVTSATPVASDPPNPPTAVTATRVSDSQIRVTWTNNSTTARPYKNLVVQRQSNATPDWATIATLGVTTAYTNTGLTGNLRYRYQVRATNAAGAFGWVQSDYVWTTPARPTAPTITDNGTDLIVGWVNNVTYTEYQTQVFRAVDGVWGANPVATLAAGVRTWTDPGRSGSTSSYAYRMRAVTTSGAQLVSPYATTTPTIAVTIPPEQPVNLKPNDQANANDYGDPANPIGLTWTYVPNDLDTADQTRYEIWHRATGGAWDEEIVESSETRHLIPAETYALGDEVEWQVRVWGDAPDPSPWSETASFACATPPPPEEPHRYPLVLDLGTGEESVTRQRLPSTATGVAVVRAAATTAISADGEGVVDGVGLTEGDRVLLVAQTNAAENGIYLVTTGSWVRANDADTAESLSLKLVAVAEGATQGGSMWRTTFGPAMRLDVDRVPWAPVPAPLTASESFSLNTLSDFAVISTQFTRITGMARAISVPGPNAVYIAHMSLTAAPRAANLQFLAQVTVDGVAAGVPARATLGANTGWILNVSRSYRVTGLTPGNHAFDVQARTSNNVTTGWSVTGTESVFTVYRIA